GDAPDHHSAPTRRSSDLGIKGGCEIDGEPAPGAGVSVVFDNPTLRPASVQIVPRVLSFDIETDPRGRSLLAISLFSPELDCVLIDRKSTRLNSSHVKISY